MHFFENWTTSVGPRVARTPGVWYVFTSKCASHHNSVHFFDISTSKIGPKMVCFDTFYSPKGFSVLGFRVSGFRVFRVLGFKVKGLRKHCACAVKTLLPTRLRLLDDAVVSVEVDLHVNVVMVYIKMST